jgi:hypothetical protein
VRQWGKPSHGTTGCRTCDRQIPHESGADGRGVRAEYSSRVAQIAEKVQEPVRTGLATLAAEQPTHDDKPHFDVETGTGGPPDLMPEVQPEQPAVPAEVTPDSHDFSTKSWMQANPGGPEEAKQAAQTLGYNVVD